MELQTKANSVMSDEKIVDLYWQRDEQAIKETDIKYKKFLLSVAMNIVHDSIDSRMKGWRRTETLSWLLLTGKKHDTN